MRSVCILCFKIYDKRIKETFETLAIVEMYDNLINRAIMLNKFKHTLSISNQLVTEINQ